MKSIILLTVPDNGSTLNICAEMTFAALSKLTAHVTLEKTAGLRSTFWSDLTRLNRIIPVKGILYCTLDGNTNLDKFAIIRLLRPDISLIWEIHAPVEELLSCSPIPPHYVSIRGKSLKRRLLSRFAQGAVCLSPEIQKYAGKLGIRKTVVIPSFIDPIRVKKALSVQTPVRKLFTGLRGISFVVLWGGAAHCRWQAVDMLRSVAEIIYRIDRTILFVTMGNESWTDITGIPNILSLHRQPYDDFLRIASQADVCLALYHPHVIFGTGLNFYFSPRKIIDAMAVGTPVITTDFQENNPVIHGKNGFRTSNNIAEVSAYIMKLRTNRRLAEKMKAQTRQTARHVNTEMAKSQLQQLFRLME